MNVKFPILLRFSAIAIIVAVTIRYLPTGSIPPPLAFINVVILVLLSFSYARLPRLSAAVSLVPGLMVPILVLLGYLRGNVGIFFVVFDWILFGCIVWYAIGELRRRRPISDVAKQVSVVRRYEAGTNYAFNVEGEK